MAALLPLEAVIVAGTAAACDRAASGAPAAAVAAKGIGLPFTPGEVAVNVFAPAAVPRVQLPTAATPLAVVVRLAPVMLPPPDAAANGTQTPATGFPLACLTITDRRVVTAVITGAVWFLP